MSRPEGEGPVFRAPWQAQAFALVVKLHEGGAFTWAEWSRALAEEIRRHGGDDGDGYYEHWLSALERLVATKGLVGEDERLECERAWAAAYRATPHGQPVELRRELRAQERPRAASTTASG